MGRLYVRLAAIRAEGARAAALDASGRKDWGNALYALQGLGADAYEDYMRTGYVDPSWLPVRPVMVSTRKPVSLALPSVVRPPLPAELGEVPAVELGRVAGISQRQMASLRARGRVVEITVNLEAQRESELLARKMERERAASNHFHQLLSRKAG